MDGRLLTIDEVAVYMGVHRDTVYNLIRSGRLRAFQLGGRKAGWRIRDEDLSAFIEERRGDGAAIPSTNGDALEAFERMQEEERRAFVEKQREDRANFLSRTQQRPPAQ